MSPLQHYSEVTAVTQSCQTLCDPMDYGVTVQGILQARILERVEPVPSPGDLPNPAIEPGSSALQADSLPTEQQNCGHVANTFLIQSYFLNLWALALRKCISSVGSEP